MSAQDLLKRGISSTKVHYKQAQSARFSHEACSQYVKWYYPASTIRLTGVLGTSWNLIANPCGCLMQKVDYKHPQTLKPFFEHDDPARSRDEAFPVLKLYYLDKRCPARSRNEAFPVLKLYYRHKQSSCRSLEAFPFEY